MTTPAGRAVVAVAAMSANRVIGRGGGLPWHIPEDLSHFKRLTVGKPCILGRTTQDEIAGTLGKPLPKRVTVVVTRDAARVRFADDTSVRVAGSPGAALAAADEAAEALGASEVVVAGGASIYEALLERTDRLELTLLDAEVTGDAWFPEWEAGCWREVASSPLVGKWPGRFVSFVRV